MKTFFVGLVLAIFPTVTFAQTEPISYCDVENDPYQCGCPLELTEKIGSCAIIDLDALPDYLGVVDTSAWLSTTWDEEREQWRVSMDLSLAEHGPFFNELSNGGDFGSQEARDAWVAQLYNLPLNNGKLPQFYVVQRGFGRLVDKVSNTIRTDRSQFVHEMLTPPYNNCDAPPAVYLNTEVTELKGGFIRGTLEHCGSRTNRYSDAVAVGKYATTAVIGEEIDIYVEADPAPPVYTWVLEDGVWQKDTVAFPAGCETVECVVDPFQQRIRENGVVQNNIRWVAQLYKEVKLREGSVRFTETYVKDTNSYLLDGLWSTELPDPGDGTSLRIVELATQMHEHIDWAPPNDEQNFGTGDWNERDHAFDFVCSSVLLPNGDKLNMAVGEYEVQTSGPDIDTYDVDIWYPVGAIRSDRAGIHAVLAGSDPCWRWQPEGQ